MDNAGVSISKCDAHRHSVEGKRNGSAPTSRLRGTRGLKRSAPKSQRRWGKPKREQALWVGIFKVQDKSGRKKTKKLTARQKDNIQYSNECVEWKKGKRCSKCGRRRRIECHHSRGRAGTLLLDKSFWIPLCVNCHRWVHANPDQARKEGLLCLQGDWNRPKGKERGEAFRGEARNGLVEVPDQGPDDGGED